MGDRKSKQSINKILALLKVLDRDKRYDPEAYSFVMSALNFTTKKLKRDGHVSGQELLEGIRDYALEEFGPMTRMVFEHWGIKKTDDFGEIVFNMIGAGMLGKTEKDSKKDFRRSFDFKAAFDESCKYSLH